MTAPFIVCWLITTLSALVSLAFSLAAIRPSTGTTLTMALYASARSFALVVTSILAFSTGSVAWLQAVACSMVLVQALDAAIGVRINDRVKTLGPAATAIVNLAALVWLIHAA